MAPEYAEILSGVAAALEPLGFEFVEHKSFLCVLGKSDRFVVLEGEPRVRGAFGLGIAQSWPVAPDFIFSLRLLMQVFGENERPSLQNQLNFLISHMEDIFCNLSAYVPQYRKLNGE